MLNRCSALVILLFGVAVLFADDEKKTKDANKDAKELQGTLVKMDYAKKTIRLKLDDGEKDFPLANDAVVNTPGGAKVKLFGKGPQSENGARQMLGYAHRPGSQIKLTLSDDGKMANQICILFGSNNRSAPKNAGGPPKSDKPSVEKKTPQDNATDKKAPDKAGK
jgi:hypothetical protein